MLSLLQIGENAVSGYNGDDVPPSTTTGDNVPSSMRDDDPPSTISAQSGDIIEYSTT